MLLAVDVGNTDIAFGLFEGERLLHRFHLESSRTRTADEYAVLVRDLAALRKVEPEQVEAAIVASVAPNVTEVISTAVRRAFDVESHIVGPETNTGMPVLYDDPREVGADRIINAVAAYERVKGAVIVVDCSTATIFDVITPKGEYLGGAISPGIGISAEALFARASKLHRVDLAAPPKAVARNTQHAMQSGIVLGFACLVDEMVKRIHEEVGWTSRIIATGAYAHVVAGHAKTIERVDDALTLEGLRIVWARNATFAARPQ